jgi:hypothetical protein
MTSTSSGPPGVSELQSKIQSDLNTARKAQDKNAVLLLGTILADIKNRRIEEKRELSDAEVNEVLRKGIKKRRESIEMYDKALRADLADRERAEVAALEAYLPANVRRRDSRGHQKGDRGGRHEHRRRDGKGESDVQRTRRRSDHQPDRERGVEQPPLSSSRCTWRSHE